MTNTTWPVCGCCGKAITDTILTWIGAQAFHSNCLRNRTINTPLGPSSPPIPGGVTFHPHSGLTAEDVRRIVREELDRAGRGEK